MFNNVVVGQGDKQWRKDGALSGTKKRLFHNKPRDFCGIALRGYGALAVVSVFIYWFCFIWRTQDIMETYLHEHNLLKHMSSMRGPPFEPVSTVMNDEGTGQETASTKKKRFILFSGQFPGQGSGNIVNGLLAAHMLGDEFDRIVCIENYDSFNLAFQSKFSEQCEQLDASEKRDSNNSISLVNFRQQPNECEVRDKLSSDVPIIFFRGNTYPRWSAVPDNFFTRYYEPSKALKETVPWWPTPPEVVVHLRQPDGKKDARRGLDNATLDALGKTLPSDTFLVTNNVEWYEMFASRFGWKNPGWNRVRHSGFNLFLWSKSNGSTKKEASSIKVRGSNGEIFLSEQDKQDLQMWSDWYTLMSATKVYHTHSDFSLSAIHWMGIASKTIIGCDADTNELQLLEEPWRLDEDCPRLVDRTPNELHNCGPSKQIGNYTNAPVSIRQLNARKAMLKSMDFSIKVKNEHARQEREQGLHVKPHKENSPNRFNYE